MGGRWEPEDESVMREKRSEVKAKVWNGHQECRTGLEGGFGGRRDMGSPPWWEVAYIRSEGERRGMCLVFQSDCVARHHY